MNYGKKKKKPVKKKNRWLRTKAWGCPSWFVFHSYAMSYPVKNPSTKEKNIYKLFYKTFGKVLPCSLCRDSYAIFVKKCPLNNNVLKTRRNLAMWTFKIHNMVNKKLGCKLLTKAQMERKYKYYEQFRAQGCSKELKGCVRAKKGIRKPKRTKVVTLRDKRYRTKN